MLDKLIITKMRFDVVQDLLYYSFFRPIAINLSSDELEPDWWMVALGWLVQVRRKKVNVLLSQRNFPGRLS